MRTTRAELDSLQREMRALAAGPRPAERRSLEDALTAACGLALSLRARSDRAERQLQVALREQASDAAGVLRVQLAGLADEIAELRRLSAALRRRLEEPVRGGAARGPRPLAGP